VKEIHDKVEEIRESQIRMEADVKHHIKRTDILQEKVTPVFIAYTGIKWFLGTVIALSAVYSALHKLGILN
jgi:hypothetical protein